MTAGIAISCVIQVACLVVYVWARGSTRRMQRAVKMTDAQLVDGATSCLTERALAITGSDTLRWAAIADRPLGIVSVGLRGDPSACTQVIARIASAMRSHEQAFLRDDGACILLLWDVSERGLEQAAERIVGGALVPGVGAAVGTVVWRSGHRDPRPRELEQAIERARGASISIDVQSQMGGASSSSVSWARDGEQAA